MPDPEASMPGATPPRLCPLCGKPRAGRYRPFCSKRCADVDLARWLGGNYRIAANETDEGEIAPGPRAADDPDG